MARLLQKSNQPSTNTSSWGGLFSCCFANPRSTPSPPPVIPSSVLFGSGQENANNQGTNQSKTATTTNNSANLVAALAGTSQANSKDSAIKVQGPLSQASEREVADGNSVVSQGSEANNALNKVAGSIASGAAGKSNGNISRKTSSRIEDEVTGKKSRPSSQHMANRTNDTPNFEEAMYNSWAGKTENNPSRGPPSVTLSEIAGRKGANQAPSGQETPQGSHSPTSAHEFVEEKYTKGYNWQSQSNLSLQESLNVPANATVNTHIRLDYKQSNLVVQIKNVENAPSEENAGSQAYQVRLALIGLKKKKRWHTHIVPAPNPTFNEEATFKGITPDELARLALRIRLYGCRRHRRHFIFAESTVGFTSLNIRAGEADIPFTLISKVGQESVVDSDSDTGDDATRAGGSRFGSRLSLHSRASMRSNFSHRSGSRTNRRPSTGSVASRTATSEVLPELETARRVAADKDANWPELLCGLAYNNTTRRLNVSVLRATRLRVPEGSFRSPKVYVSMTIVNETGEKITSSKTHDVHLAMNTEFGEKFAFDLNALDPRSVTLFVRVYQKHHVHKHESLGWFAIGAKNNGEEERTHWNEMLQAQGREITRWHALNENVS